MRRALKVVVWALVLLASAGVGAYVAAHTDPFPPDVATQPNRLPTPPSHTPEPELERWQAKLVAFSYHEQFVGGRCTTRWRGSIDLTIDDRGRAGGRGDEILVGDLVCDFPNPQRQAERIQLTAEGSRRGAVLTLRFTDGTRLPVGARDYGGFGPTIRDVVARITIDGVTGRTVVTIRKPDGEGRGEWYSRLGVSVRCQLGCE